MADAPKLSGPALAPGVHFDPETVPPDPAFADFAVRGPAVPLERLRVPALRARFAAPPAWQPEMRADGRVLDPERAARAAAVLMPLVVRPSGVHVLLTQRTAHLHDHAGQISFPGGRVDEGDADPVATALRESQEEIGLDPARVEIIGHLPEYVTATSYRVTPVIGLIEQPLDVAALQLDTFEVAEAFEVPLAFLMDPRNHERRRVVMGELSRTFYAIPYQGARRYFIWGATAAMLRNLYQLMRA
jgi:8-oxo-dGTP pyrophosphatase MutT (NUDIX family)